MFTNMYKKFKDTAHSGDLGDAIAGSEFDPTTPLCLNGIGQGNGESEYLGRGYEMSSLIVTGHIEWKNFSVATDKFGDLARILIVLDKQTNASQFNAEDVLKNSVSGGFDIDAPRNLEYTHRFVVLKDLVLQQPTLGFAATGTDEFVKQPFKIILNFKKPIKVLTKDTGNTVASINDNSLHVMAYASRGSSHANLRYTSRIRFYG